MSSLVHQHAKALWGSVLARRLLTGLVVTLTVCSLAFLAIFAHFYRDRLLQDHARASMQLNETLRASLENAMLKRDLPGLRAIVDRAGHQDGVAAVMILDPAGEVRFSSDRARIGKDFASIGPGQALAGLSSPVSSYTRDPAGVEVLRTINPVHNQTACGTCHGPAASHPVNGLLVVDYQAGRIRSEAQSGALALAISGGMVTLVALLALASMVYRFVLRPLQSLTEATARFAAGELSARVEVADRGELAVLADRFNGMAGRLETTVGELRASEGFLQSVIDAMPDGVRVIGSDFTVLKVNRAHCEQLGIDDSQAIGAKCHALSHASAEPCSHTLITCPVEALRGRPGEALRCRHRHFRADGSELFVEVSAAAVDLEIGGRRQTCVIEATRDLAEQTRLSQEQRLSELGHLATGIAHEVFNPLSSIRFALRSVREDTAAEPLPAKVDQYLTIVDHEIERCVEMTGRLLRLSEPAAGGDTLVDMASTIGDVVSLLRYQTQAAGIAVSCAIEPGLRVIGAESDIGMVAVNLIQNAVHAMPQGGQLTIAGQREGELIVLRFIDSGVGISAADLPHLFWPFWSKRANASRGTGLGLSICKTAIERMGGTIAVASEEGKGATFTVILPSADQHEERI